MPHKVKVSLRIETPALTSVPLRHNIEVELDHEFDRGNVVFGAIPQEFTDNPKRIFVGRERGLLGAVLDWLKQVDQSVDYIPAHNIEEDRQQRERESSLEKEDIC
jgi:hypothetical protein